MSEGPNKCETELYKRIVELLDPIIKYGIESTSSPNPTPTPTPTPTQAPLSSNDIDKCITDTIEDLKGVFKKSYPDLSYESFIAEDTRINSEPFKTLKSLWEDWFIRSVKYVVDTYKDYSPLTILDGVIKTDDYVFKQADFQHNRLVLIPRYAATTGPPLALEDSEYLSNWNASDSFYNLNWLECSLLLQLSNVITIKALSDLRDNNNVDKKALINKLVNDFENSNTALMNQFNSNQEWGRNNIKQDSEDASRFNWQSELKKVHSVLGPNTVLISEALAPITRLKQCINN